MMMRSQRTGSRYVSHCRTFGMRAIGKAKPDSVKSGLTKKKLVAKACCWVLQTVEITNPIARVLSRYRDVPSSRTSGLALNGS